MHSMVEGGEISSRYQGIFCCGNRVEVPAVAAPYTVCGGPPPLERGRIATLKISV